MGLAIKYILAECIYRHTFCLEFSVVRSASLVTKSPLLKRITLSLFNKYLII
jgi:hypothetical protein